MELKVWCKITEPTRASYWDRISINSETHISGLKKTIAAKFSPGTLLDLHARMKGRKWHLYGFESIMRVVKHFEGENEPDYNIVFEDDVLDEEWEIYRKLFVKEIILYVEVITFQSECTISFL